MIIRTAFITNSSSTHYVVRDPKQKVLHMEPWGSGEFGWQNFLLARPEDKKVYMAVCLLQNIKYTKSYILCYE